MPSKYATTSNVRYDENMHCDITASEGLPSSHCFVVLGISICNTYCVDGIEGFTIEMPSVMQNGLKFPTDKPR